MDFDLKSKVEDESMDGFHQNMLLLVLGLTGLFVLPSLFLILLIPIFSNLDIHLLEYIAYFFGYGSYIGILFYILKKEKIKKILKGFDINNLKVAIVFFAILYLASLLTSSILILIFGKNLTNANQSSLNDGLVKYPFVLFFFSVILAPIVEEFVFRFSIFRPINKKNKILAYIITILLFAGIHFLSSFGTLSTNLEKMDKAQAYAIFFSDFKTLPIYIVGALVLTVSYDVNKNISTSIMVHAIYNFSQFIGMLIKLNNPIAGQISSSLTLIDLNLIKNCVLSLGIL